MPRILWRWRAMRAAIALAFLSGAQLLPLSTIAHADWSQAAPWCAALGGTLGGFDCGYYSFEQCMATARGLGGYCSPNPRALHDAPRKPRRTRGPYR
jgi:hypothetical protein